MYADQLPKHSARKLNLRVNGRSRALAWNRTPASIRRRRERPERETPEIISNAASLVKGLGKRLGEGDPEHLALFRSKIRAAARTAEDVAVPMLRANGYSDTMIADALQISRQAVEQRWPWPKEET